MQFNHFVTHWLFPTNHKDTGTLYLWFGGIAEVIGKMLSIFLMELIMNNPNNTLKNNTNNILSSKNK